MLLFRARRYDETIRAGQQALDLNRSSVMPREKFQWLRILFRIASGLMQRAPLEEAEETGAVRRVLTRRPRYFDFAGVIR